MEHESMQICICKFADINLHTEIEISKCTEYSRTVECTSLSEKNVKSRFGVLIAGHTNNDRISPKTVRYVVFFMPLSNE